MTRRDHERLEALYKNINTLMDVPPQVNPVVSTAEIVEAVQEDIALVMSNKPIKYTDELIERDRAASR